MPISTDYNDVILECSACNNSIKVQISKRGSTRITDAINRASAEAKKRKWNRDPDICPNH